MIHAALHKKSSTKCKGNFGPIFISIRFLQNCFLLTSQGICVLRHYNYFWYYDQYVNVRIFYDPEWCTHVIISKLQVCILWFSVLAIICVCLSLLFLNILHFQRIVKVIKDT